MHGVNRKLMLYHANYIIYLCIEIQVLMMSNICEDYTDGNKKQVKILPVNSNELALSALLRNNLIARIRG